MRTEWKLAAGTLVAAGALALPASAAAAITAGPLQACYTAVPPSGVGAIPVTLTGGTPGDLYQIVASYPNKAAGSAGSISPATPFDANGNGGGTLTDIYPNGDPIDPIAGTPVDLSVEDFNPAFPNGSDTTQVGSILITTRALNVNDKPSNPRLARNVAISGTQFANKQIYGFVTNRAGTEVLRRFHIGKGNVCGFTEHKEIVAPTRYAGGTYRLYVGPGPKLAKKSSLSTEFTIETS